MSHRWVGLAVAAAALAALGVAYWAQDFLLLVPCPLCLWERWPYRVVVALGILAILVRPWTARVVLGIAALTMLVGAGIAFLHVGVEWHDWKSPLPECNGFFSPDAPLPATPAPPCDAPTDLIPGLHFSMAEMDFVYAVAFALVVAAYVMRRQRRFK
jgi:disulfide bond formation protein DsbB